MESPNVRTIALFDSQSYYFGFTSGQWRFYYASGQSLRGNPSKALLDPEGVTGSD